MNIKASIFKSGPFHPLKEGELVYIKGISCDRVLVETSLGEEYLITPHDVSVKYDCIESVMLISLLRLRMKITTYENKNEYSHL